MESGVAGRRVGTAHHFTTTLVGPPLRIGEAGATSHEVSRRLPILAAGGPQRWWATTLVGHNAGGQCPPYMKSLTNHALDVLEVELDCFPIPARASPLRG